MKYILCRRVSNLFLLVGIIGDSDRRASIKLVSDLAIGDSEEKKHNFNIILQF